MDGLSYYANSLIQSMFHCSTIRKKSLESAEKNVLKATLNQYISNGVVDIKILRTFAGAQFMRNEQQCPCEFFESLRKKSEALNDLVNLEQSMKTKCPNIECDYVRPTSPLDRRIFKLMLPLNPNEITYDRLINLSNRTNRRMIV